MHLFRTNRALGEAVGQRPVIPTTTKNAVPSSPSSVSSRDSLEATIKKHSSFTRYLGGTFLSVFSVTVFISCAALIALTCLSFITYKNERESFTSRYLADMALPSHIAEVTSFLSNGTEAYEWLGMSNDYAVFFTNFACVDSIMTVDISESPVTFIRYVHDGAVLSNAQDCGTSPLYSCDSAYYQSSANSLVNYTWSTDEYTWDGPEFILSSNETVSIPFVTVNWNNKTDDSLNRIFVKMDLEFSSDVFLDKFSAWLINGETNLIASELGLAASELASVLKVDNGTTVVTLPNLVNQIGAFSIGASTTLSNDLEIISGQVLGTPFVVVVGTEAETESSDLYWYLLISLIVAGAPVVGTLLIGAGYSLRLVAVRRKKQQRAMEVEDARLAVQAMRELKIRQANLPAGKR